MHRPRGCGRKTRLATPTHTEEEAFNASPSAGHGPLCGKKRRQLAGSNLAVLGMLASADACCLRKTVILDGDVNDQGQNLVTLHTTCTRSIPRGVRSTMSRAWPVSRATMGGLP
jgi:hypothetical protein